MGRIMLLLIMSSALRPLLLSLLFVDSPAVWSGCSVGRGVASLHECHRSQQTAQTHWTCCLHLIQDNKAFVTKPFSSSRAETSLFFMLYSNLKSQMTLICFSFLLLTVLFLSYFPAGHVCSVCCAPYSIWVKCYRLVWVQKGLICSVQHCRKWPRP